MRHQNSIPDGLGSEAVAHIEYALPVTGLNCAGCAGRAERALQAVTGVEHASVNLATATASVAVERASILSDMVAAAAKAGYPLAERDITLQLEGMHCGSCVARAEAALAALNGVQAVTVTLTDAKARVRFIDGAADVGQLQVALKQVGFGAQLLDAAEAQSPDAEIQILRRDFFWALAFTLPVFVLEMGGHAIPALHHWLMANIGNTVLWPLQAVLTAIVLLGPGRRFFTRGIPALMRGAPDMNALVALGTSAAFGFSLVSTFAPGLFPAGAVHVYYESAATIVTLILLGRWLEARAKGRTGEAIRALAGLQPDAALVIKEGQTIETPIAEIVPGDRIRLRPGERVAVDGLVISGSGAVDESMLSGEPVPNVKTIGDEVSAGTVNGTAVLDIEVRGVGAQTRLARIISLVEQAQGTKLPVQALVDRITLWFVPVVLLIALLTVVIWLAVGQGSSFALVAGVAVLIIACPCAMGLATPTSIMVGLGRAAQMGVLFRKGTALQELSNIDLVVFDKTGTLTEGHPVLQDVFCADGWSRERALAVAAAVEAQSEHPIAHAIVSAHEGELQDATDLVAVPGKGITAQVADQAVVLGRLSFVADGAVLPASWSAKADELAKQGATPIVLAVDGAAAALMSVSDPIRAEAAQTVAALKHSGLAVAMISGDAIGTATYVARALGIDIVHGECLPEEKLAALQELQTTFGAVAFVGDGINDAPALAASDCGIALGTGTDVAIEAAEVVLSSGNPIGVVNALKISRATLRNIRQNLGWAFGYNVLLVPVAAGLLVPFGGPQLSPALAAGAMAASSVLVLSNALRLRRLKPSLHVEGG